MLKKHMAACLVATALAAAPALAQTTPPPPPSAGTDRPLASGTGSTATGSSAMQPGVVGSPAGGAPAATGTAAGTTTPTPPAAAPAPSGTAGTTAPAAPPPATGTAGTTAPQTTASSAGAAQGQFMTRMQANQMMASNLIGTTVVSANNESIGDVNDVILDRNGQAMAVVIGVGGFLGIGEKDVAVSFDQLDFASGEQMNRQTSGATGTTGTGTAAGGTATTGSPATTGATGTGASTATGSSAGGVPDRVVLRITKAELEAAPTFARSNRNSDGDNAGGTGGTTAPARP